jgi:hypothetical protein
MSSPLRSVLLRRIWLPRWLYESLPWLYLACGAGALWGGLFGGDGAWYYPYAALAGLAALHGALWVSVVRRRRRRLTEKWSRRQEARTTTLAPPVLAAGQVPPGPRLQQGL